MIKITFSFVLICAIASYTCIADNKMSYPAPVKLFCDRDTYSAPPKSPLVRPFGNNNFWILTEDMTYVIGKTNERIVVPKGFVTDFASIPPLFVLMGLTPQNQYSRAAVIHDYLYWSQGCTKDQADRLLVIAMKESRVGKSDEFVVYQGVKIGGGKAWEENKAERKSGFPRIIPEKYLHPNDPNMNWPEYRKMLFNNGVEDPTFEQNPSYCAYGNSTNVP